MKWYTVAVDFDGVLHRYASGWIDAETIPDGPVDGALEWLSEIVERFDVVILSSRARTRRGRKAIRLWLTEHAGRDLASSVRVQGKPTALIYVDDRAWRFNGKNFPSADEIHRAIPWCKPPAPAGSHQAAPGEGGDSNKEASS